eukprot:3152902-Prymnesium_polylepis.1
MWVGGGRPTDPHWTPPSDADREINFATPCQTVQRSSDRLPGLPVSILKVTAQLQLWGGGGENGDLEFQKERSMTEGLDKCRTTMQTP